MRFLADFIVVFHFLFIVFVVAGGLLVIRWRWIALAHVPSALWGLSTEFFGWWCPLTPLENRLRAYAGGTGYDVGFIEHYILPAIYPVHLTREVQIAFGAAALAINIVIYSVVCFGRARAAASGMRKARRSK